MTASTFNLVYVNANYPSLQVVAASNPPISCLLYNADPTITIYLSNNNSVNAGDVNHSTPLPPLSSVTFDGTQDVFAATVPSTTAALQVYPSGSSYFATLGQANLASLGSATGGTGAIIASGGVPYNIINAMPVGQYASYDLSCFMFATSQGTAGHAMAVLINMQWFDDLISDIPVFEEDWYVWCMSSAPTVAGHANVVARGPMSGKYLTINVSTPPSSSFPAVLQYFNIFGSNRPQVYSDWRQNPNTLTAGVPLSAGLGTIASVSPLGGTSYDNILAQISGYTLTMGQGFMLPLGLYAGPVFASLITPNALSAASIVVMNNLLSGGVNTTTNPLYSFPATAGGTYTVSGLILPRAPCAMLLSGNNPIVSFVAVGQQAA
jgi:hypothetical protein